MDKTKGFVILLSWPVSCVSETWRVFPSWVLKRRICKEGVLYKYEFPSNIRRGSAVYSGELPCRKLRARRISPGRYPHAKDHGKQYSNQFGSNSLDRGFPSELPAGQTLHDHPGARSVHWRSNDICPSWTRRPGLWSARPSPAINQKRVLYWFLLLRGTIRGSWVLS